MAQVYAMKAINQAIVRDEILANMQVSIKRYDQLVRAMAPSGNLFFLLTIRGLRRQGLTFLAFYVLQRAVEELEISEHWLRRETGLQNYEISRACTFLASSGLIGLRKSNADARVRLLTPTAPGDSQPWQEPRLILLSAGLPPKRIAASRTRQQEEQIHPMS
jgi:hypothetical protein